VSLFVAFTTITISGYLVVARLRKYELGLLSTYHLSYQRYRVIYYLRGTDPAGLDVDFGGQP
jgi:hypothetical protein